ncbi:MAG: hypothetical protein JNJ77_07210 [Planctomycetia bacterium]|nr:hypothetical protein [Planctomycetia bacterium]
MISDQTAASLLANINVAFNGLPTESVKYNKHTNTFSVNLKTGKPPVGTYDLTLRITIGGVDVALAIISIKLV